MITQMTPFQNELDFEDSPATGHISSVTILPLMSIRLFLPVLSVQAGAAATEPVANPVKKS